MPTERIYDSVDEARSALEVSWSRDDDHVMLAVAELEDGEFKNSVGLRIGDAEIDRLISILKRVRRRDRYPQDILLAATWDEARQYLREHPDKDLQPASVESRYPLGRLVRDCYVTAAAARHPLAGRALDDVRRTRAMLPGRGSFHFLPD